MFIDLRRIVFAAAVVGLGALGWSMLHDDVELEARAAELACRGKACNATLRKKTKDLFGWTFAFTAYGDENLVVSVACTRPLWVVGDYRCDVAEAERTADGRFKDR